MFRKSLIISCAAVLFALLCCQSVCASPDDVRGSGNIAVCGYTNREGSFVLWSNGRITDLSGNQVCSASSYSSVSGYKKPKAVSGQIAGSKNVAVGIIQAAGSTCVVFADGTVKKPASAKASALPAENTMIGGVINIAASFAGASYTSGNGWKAQLGKDSLKITFTEPFSETPVILIGDADEYPVYISESSKTGFTLKKTSGASPNSLFKICFAAFVP